MLTPIRNSNMPGFLLFHHCFSVTVSQPLQCYQRAGILHSFPAQRRLWKFKCALYSFLFTFLASFKVFLLYKDPRVINSADPGLLKYMGPDCKMLPYLFPLTVSGKNYFALLSHPDPAFNRLMTCVGTN